MLVCLRLGLQNLSTTSKDEKAKKYSLLIADTFVVTKDGAECLTDAVQRKPKKVQWNLDGPEDEKEAKSSKKIASKEEIDGRLKEEEHRRRQDKMSEAERAAEREQFEKRNQENAQKKIGGAETAAQSKRRRHVGCAEEGVY